MDEKSPFRVELQRPRADLAVVVVEGELDIYTASRLKEALDEGIDAGAQRLIVDHSNVPFIDSAGLGMLVGGLKRVQPRGGSLDIVCDRANVVRTFCVAALLGIFGLHATREEALVTSGGPGKAD